MIYLYGVPNRPPVYGGIPSGFTLVSGSDARMPDATRHGVVAYHDPLTPEQVAAYQLVPILTPEEAASMIADSLRKYASTYLCQPAPQFAKVVGQRLDRLGVAVPMGKEKLSMIVRSLLDSVSG